MAKPITIEQYVKAAAPSAQPLLEELWKALREAVPQADPLRFSAIKDYVVFAPNRAAPSHRLREGHGRVPLKRRSRERRPLDVSAAAMARFIAPFIGSVSSAEKAAYSPAPEEEAMWADGITAWGEWMEKHSDSIVDAGSPLGGTLRASPSGIAPHENRVVAFVVVSRRIIRSQRKCSQTTLTS